MEFSLAKRWLYVSLIVATCIGNVLIYSFVFSTPSQGKLVVSFLDVGQGDAILIQGPTGVDVLIDGGPDRSVLRELSKKLRPWDRHIDAIIETHPDKDHIAGLGDVLARYRVSYFLESGIPDTTATSEHVKEMVKKEEGLNQSIVLRGTRLTLGGGAYADVLYPATEQSHQAVTNDGSIAIRVVYGSTSVMLTGDLSSEFEDSIVASYGEGVQSDVLKAAHHGSKYSTDTLWLTVVDPSYVVISAGKNNKYGHPAEEVIERIRQQGAEVVSTIQSGTVTFVSDGMEIVQK